MFLQAAQDTTNVGRSFFEISTKDLSLILATAAFTAFFTQLAVILYNLYISYSRRRQIKKLIEKDLEGIKWNLQKMSPVFVEIQQNVRNGMNELLSVYEYPTFNDEVYKAIPVTDLFDTYGKYTPMLVSIYNGVAHFMKHSPRSYYHATIERLGGSGSHGNFSTIVAVETDSCQKHIDLVKHLIKTIDDFTEWT